MSNEIKEGSAGSNAGAGSTPNLSSPPGVPSLNQKGAATLAPQLEVDGCASAAATRAFRLFLLASMCTLQLACGDSKLTATDDPQMAVDVMLSQSGIRVLKQGSQPLTEILSEGSASALRYEFKSGATMLAAGILADPRLLRAEFDEHLTADPRQVTSALGLVSLALPNQEGTLIFYDGAQVLGSQVLSRNFHLTLTQDLMSEADILTQPVYYLGSTSSPLRLMFVGDGYLPSESGTFHNDAKKLLDGLLAHPDYAPYAGKIAAAYATVGSPNSGIDDPAIGTNRPTAFEMSFGTTTRRCIWFQSSEGMTRATLLRDRVKANIVVVIANTTEYAGCATGGIVALSRDPNGIQVLAHELGHAVFALADEYDSGLPASACHEGDRTGSPNVSSTFSRSALPWADLVAASTPLPTPDRADTASLVGAFQGAGYCTVNRWRSQHDCLMRSLNTPMCAVCRREMARLLAGSCDGATNWADGKGCVYSFTGTFDGKSNAASSSSLSSPGLNGYVSGTCTGGTWTNVVDTCK